MHSLVRIIQKARYFSLGCVSCSARAEISRRRALRRSRGDTEQKRVRRLRAFPPLTSPKRTEQMLMQESVLDGIDNSLWTSVGDG